MRFTPMTAKKALSERATCDGEMIIASNPRYLHRSSLKFLTRRNGLARREEAMYGNVRRLDGITGCWMQGIGRSFETRAFLTAGFTAALLATFACGTKTVGESTFEDGPNIVAAPTEPTGKGGSFP